MRLIDRSIVLIDRSVDPIINQPTTHTCPTQSPTNPLTPTTDNPHNTSEQQVAQTLDLGDGKTQKIYERIKVEPAPEHRPPIKLAGPVGKITRCDV